MFHFCKRPARPRSIPGVERLEDRTTPAVVTVLDGVLTYRADAGETNDLTIQVLNGKYAISDEGAAVVALGAGAAEAGFSAIEPNMLFGGSDLVIERVEIVLGDGDDQVQFQSADPVRMRGQAGKDDLRVAPSSEARCTLLGGAGDDDLFGGLGADRVLGGRDLLSGRGGNDLSAGGAGRDILRENPDSDGVVLGPTRLRGPSLGTDVLSSVEAAQLVGGGGDNRLDARAFSGPVTLLGGGGNDTLLGGPGSDALFGGAGDDRSVGNAGDDLLHDFSGFDTLTGGVGNDDLGGSGMTTIAVESVAGRVVLTDTRLTGRGHDTLANVGGVKLRGGAGADCFDLSGWTGGNGVLRGRGGVDLVRRAGGGVVTLSPNGITFGANFFHFVGIEAARLLGSPGDDAFTVAGWAGPLTLAGGAGFDTVTVLYTVFGGKTFVLRDGSLTVSGIGTAVLAGFEQALLVGGDDTDVFKVSGWSGAVSLSGGLGLDTVVSRHNGNQTLTNGLLTRAGKGAVTLLNTTVERARLVGGPGDDLLDASGFALGRVTLRGGGGDDTLLGGNANDLLDGGPGLDDLDGNGGIDTLLNGEANTQD